MAATYVDCSTVSPKLSGELAETFPARFLAMPVVGSPVAVRAGRARQATPSACGPDLSTTQWTRPDYWCRLPSGGQAARPLTTGHAFFAVDRPSYRPEAAVDGWRQILD
jgi:hypothetical protein